MFTRIKSHSVVFRQAVRIGLMITGIGTLCIAEDAISLLSRADAAYAKREDIPQAKIAMITYERAGVLGSTSAVEGYWKASRAAWWLAEHTDMRAEKLEYYQRGIDDAKRALALNADAVPAHFWLGCNEGSFGDTKGVMKSLSLVKPIRQEMREVIRLNEHFSDGGAWRVLGVVDYKVPGLMGGRKSRAKEELDKALGFGPNNPFNHYFMAEYYKTIGDKAKKDVEIAALRALHETAELGPELKMMQERAARL
jgi:tetratricopeptide (TPR) repeat protein